MVDIMNIQMTVERGGKLPKPGYLHPVGGGGGGQAAQAMVSYPTPLPV